MRHGRDRQHKVLDLGGKLLAKMEAEGAPPETFQGISTQMPSGHGKNGALFFVWLTLKREPFPNKMGEKRGSNQLGNWVNVILCFARSKAGVVRAQVAPQFGSAESWRLPWLGIPGSVVDTLGPCARCLASHDPLKQP